MLLLLSFVCTSMLTLGVGCKKPNEEPDSGSTGGNGESGKEENTEQNPFAKLTYVAFGDNITYGAVPNQPNKQLQKPYSKLVGEKLELKATRNRGEKGATLTPNDLGEVCMTNRILSFTDAAEIISVQLGFNDWLNNLPLGTPGDDAIDTVYGALHLIAEHLAQNYQDAFVFFITPYPSALTANEEYTLEDVANAVRVEAEEYGIPVLDLYALGQFELEMNTEQSDGVHPSKDFTENYTAPQIEAFIREHYGK